MNTWAPIGTKRDYSFDRPEVGELVAWERAAWRVMHVKVVDPLPEELGKLATWPKRAAYAISLRRVHGPAQDGEDDRGEIGLRVAAGAWYRWERYEDDRVPLCSCCGHPWPCLNLDAARMAETEAKVMSDKLAKAGIPGTCYACGEPITTRQGSVTYPEPNVELIGYPGPRFHTRNACSEGQYAYERKRQAALPDVEPLHPAADTLWGNR